MAKATEKISLGESLNIENVADLKAKFDKKATAGSKLLLQSEIMTDLDLTGIQLLNYMLVQAKKKNVDLQVKLKMDSSQRDLLVRCGFDEISQKVI